jgi:hypothetical protein
MKIFPMISIKSRKTRYTKPTQDTHDQEAVHPVVHRAAAIQKNRKRGHHITPN